MPQLRMLPLINYVGVASAIESVAWRKIGRLVTGQRDTKIRSTGGAKAHVRNRKQRQRKKRENDIEQMKNRDGDNTFTRIQILVITIHLSVFIKINKNTIVHHILRYKIDSWFTKLTNVLQN